MKKRIRKELVGLAVKVSSRASLPGKPQARKQDYRLLKKAYRNGGPENVAKIYQWLLGNDPLRAILQRRRELGLPRDKTKSKLKTSGTRDLHWPDRVRMALKRRVKI